MEIVYLENEKIIEKIINKFSLENDIPKSILTIINDIDFLNIHLIYNKYIKNIMNEFINQNIEYTFSQSFIILRQKNRFYFLISNIENILDAIQFIEPEISANEILRKNSSKLESLKYEIIKTIKSSINETIHRNINDLNIFNSYDGKKIFLDLFPEMFIYKENNEIKTKEIPEKFKDKYKISKIEIILDNSERILDIKLDGKHPNSDSNNNYCIPPEIKFKKYHYKILNEIIKSISIHNLIECYFIPEYIDET